MRNIRKLGIVFSSSAAVLLITVTIGFLACRTNSSKMPANQESRAESRDKQKSDPKDQLYLKSLLNIKTIPPPDKLRRTTI